MTYEIFHRTRRRPQHHRRGVIRHLAFGLRVDAPEIELFPHLLQQLVHVPPMLGANGARVRDPVKQVKLLDRDGIDFVERVDNRYVRSALGFEHINQVINRGVATDGNIRRCNLVLLHNRFDLLQGGNLAELALLLEGRPYVMVNVGQGHGVGDVDATGVLLLENNVRRALVNANSEALQLALDDALVGERLVDIQDDEDEMACLCDGDDLTTSTLAVLGSLNNTRQVENLDLGSVVDDLTRNGSELCKKSASLSKDGTIFADRSELICRS